MISVGARGGMSHGGLAIRVDLQIEAPGGSAGVPVTSLPVPDGQEDDAVLRRWSSTGEISRARRRPTEVHAV